MNDFLAVDVETANADYSSICQIGVVLYVDGREHGSWCSLVDPVGHFDPFNVSIHGIREDHVRGMPRFSEFHSRLDALFRDRIVIHHGHFDRTAFSRCYDAFGLRPIECEWLDSTKIIRRTWKKYSRRGYGLENLARDFALDFKHHDALEDARAAGTIVMKAVSETGISVGDWLGQVQLPIAAQAGNSLKREGQRDAPFFGESIVFTGQLGLSKTELADIAQKLGYSVTPGVTRKTTCLCVGTQDLSTLAGHSKSAKHRKAESLIEQGHEIQILSEDDFWQIAKTYLTGEI
ncbi:MAG: transposase [Rhodobiaceae bacterium]|nr:transposase [Rhodobiaceae bacterium]